MKNGRFQAKDIDDVFFLRCVDWAQTYHAPLPWKPLDELKKREGEAARWPVWVFTRNLQCLMPMFPPEVILAKASALLRRGLITGCDCGCRGDFELTIDGAQFLRKAGHEVTQKSELYLCSGRIFDPDLPRVNSVGGMA